MGFYSTLFIQVADVFAFDRHEFEMSLIGLTGGIGSGKSTVCKLLIESGYEVIDSDQIAREVVQQGQPAYQQIVRVFGDSIIDDKTKAIDRPKLAAVVFSDDQKRKQLNAITHPAIYREIFKRIIRLMVRQERLIFIDLPLLFESGYMVKFLSKIVVVSCVRETQIRRIIARNGYTAEEAEQRLNAQMSLEEKCRRADRVLHNEGNLETLRVQVRQLLLDLEQQRGYWKTRFVFWVTLLGAASVLGLSVYKLAQLFRSFWLENGTIRFLLNFKVQFESIQRFKSIFKKDCLESRL